MAGVRSGRRRRAGVLLAASARPPLAAVLAGCAIIVAALGALFARQHTPDPFDRAGDSPLITWFAGHDGLALWLAFPGTTKPAIALSVGIVAACLLAGRLAGALLAVAAVRSPSGCASCSSSPWSTAPISARSSTRAGTSQPSPRWQRQSRCCCSRDRGRCWRACFGCPS